MDNLLEGMTHWVQKGMPEGATVRSTKMDGKVYLAEELMEFGFDELIKPFKCYYKDPPEQWLPLDPIHVIVKLQNYVKIRCKSKSASLDNAFDEWESIDGLLLTDVFNYNYQYLSNG